jgi:uncharacterized protein YprB with RNaseH-like and TPR domain
MKVLHLDVETAPLTVHAWRLFDQNISLQQIVAGDYMLCWAAKWDGERAIRFASLRRDGQHQMMGQLHALIQEADMVVTYNGDRFDLPWLNTEFFKAGLAPPRPCASYDLLPPIRRKFRLPSYKLAYVAQFLGVGSKVKHEGHDLWKACMAGDEGAWKRMERYNRGDVRLQERVYPQYQCQKCGGWTTDKRRSGPTVDRRPV